MDTQPAPSPDTSGEQAPEPTAEEKAGWAAVQQRATGMTHHEAKAALDAARHDAEENATEEETADDGRTAAEIEEWERIVEALADHAGAYDPDTDPFVQGERAAHHDGGPIA